MKFGVVILTDINSGFAFSSGCCTGSVGACSLFIEPLSVDDVDESEDEVDFVEAFEN